MVETAEATSAAQETTQAAAGEEEKKHDVEYADEGAQNSVSYHSLSCN